MKIFQTDIWQVWFWRIFSLESELLVLSRIATCRIKSKFFKKTIYIMSLTSKDNVVACIFNHYNKHILDLFFLEISPRFLVFFFSFYNFFFIYNKSHNYTHKNHTQTHQITPMHMLFQITIIKIYMQVNYMHVIMVIFVIFSINCKWFTNFSLF